ncbi:prepilin-type N-terminal cleavage/methylation domain-containing protein [Homoserinimonas aerilata]|uniref:Prepilin-type N-terminal cleavage/methylation domain-containing protein n=1 Tax=Homoserinimonas aerilata TaxID=1162970 RepID=A0A542Y1H9_9MICO|nr:type II secretion system protein [Homoserinimonas aerilata]TQL41920.1 prepilin-type N-terminal cleavage/methylation domain-containing protein [Homoserinimonas aerilata]
MTRPLQRFRARLGRTQAGFSLMELVVAMGIFSIFIAMFMAAVIGLTQGTTRAQLTAEASSGVLTVFQNFDRQVRYADAINFPGDAGGATYIEFRTPAESAPSEVTTCTQWRFLPDEGRIESRSWPDVAGATPTAWATKLTTAIDTGAADYPFKMIPASTSGSARQQLVLTLEAGNADMDAGASMSTTFVARNSSAGSPGNLDANGDGRSDAPACATGSRS